jgi:hypothetical protein
MEVEEKEKEEEKATVPDIQNQISEMIDSLGNKPPEPEKPAEPEKAEEPVKEEVKKEEPVTEEKKEEARVETDVVIDPRDTELESLRAKVLEFESKKPKTEVKEEPTKVEIQEQDFLKDQDIDELTRDPAKLNKVFNDAVRKAVADSRTTIMSELPTVVRNQQEVIESMRETTKEFYNSNPDLTGFKKVVQSVFEEIASTNPNQTYGEIIGKVAPEVRKRLELPSPTKTTENKQEVKESNKPPALPSSGSRAGRSTKEEPSTNSLQSELEAMNKVLGR